MIKNITNYVENELELLKKKLHDLSKNEHKLIDNVVSHVILNGKKVRPILLFLIAKSFENNNINDTISTAFAIELIHTASLLHDDVVDKTKTRRGKRTANDLWGDKETILVGDYLFTQAFLTVAKLKNVEATQIIANACCNLTEGEVFQLENEMNINITIEKYLDIIYKKTASLFEAATLLGYGKNDVDIANFGKNIGMIFQMMDDILDYFGTKTGKDVGNDFNERKVTLPVILLMKEVNSDEKSQIKNYFEKKSNLALPQIKNMMNNYDISNLCKKFMNVYVQDAKNFVDGNIKNKKMREIFFELLDFLMNRNI